MSGSRIVVIGSNSFSGSHFIYESLKSGHTILGISRSSQPNPVFLPYLQDPITRDLSKTNLLFSQCDLNKDLSQLKDNLNDFQPDLVVNFAAQGMVAESWQNPTHWYQTNVVSQVALHEFLRTLPSIHKYVHVTTPEVYGSTDAGWIKESFRFNPSTPYAVSRAACDLHLLSFFKAYGFPVVFTRASNVYGPCQQLYRIIPRAILSARTNSRMALHGGGHSVRNFIHIHDVAKATLQLAHEAAPGSSWHISGTSSISIKDLVQAIANHCSVDIASFVDITDERLGKDQSYLLDSSNIRETFGWRDTIDLTTGLSDTISWVDRNLKLLKTFSWNYEHKL